MNTLEILKAARARIEKPENWTTRKYARTAEGFQTDPLSPTAVCWCMLDALRYVANVTSDQALILLDAKAALRREINRPLDIHEFNDAREHPQVLALFDAAIEAQEDA
jgi:hypothetical protein